MLCALCVGQASALEYTMEAPDDYLFGRPTSDDTIYEWEDPNVDRSKNTALIPPGFGTPTSYLPGSSDPLTPNLIPGALDGGGLVSQTGSVNYPVIDTGNGGSSGQDVGYTAVTSDLYYSGGHLGTLKIPDIGLSTKVYEGTDSNTLATATTYLKKHKISKGETIAQSLKDRFEYGQNPDKTQGGELISSYACDHMTADAEFLLSKAKYRAVTGREQRRDADVLCYQIRQAFKPGEITPEEANRIGYETAMRWTKGKYAFFVATHTDRQHIHNHIYYNSTSLDCTRKFRDFIGSARAVRRLSDRVCLENDLSVILNPKLHSKGRFLHYGAWLGAERQPSYKERLRLAINDALAKGPADFADFLRLMAESGYAVKHGRGGVISFLVPGQERATRLRASTLGEGYDPENIRAVIAGKRPVPHIHDAAAPTPRRVNLIVDIQERLRSGKGPAYERWAKVYNLKQMAAALMFLQEHQLTEYDQLAAQADGTAQRFHALAGELRQTEADLAKTSALMEAVVQYAKSRPVFEGYKAARYSKKYLAEHGPELADYRAAKAALNELLDGEKLPKMDALKEKRRKLAARKKALYAEYRAAQQEMREAVAVKANIDHLLGLSDERKNKEQER